MLSVRNLHAGYGNKDVLRGVSLDVPRGAIVTLLGANGAGKSTLLKSIVGLLSRTSGDVELDGRALPNTTPDRVLKAGVSLVPEQRELFLGMSVADNLRLGGFLRRRGRSRSTPTSSACSIYSRAFSRGCNSRREPCRAASSKCWRSRAP